MNPIRCEVAKLADVPLGTILRVEVSGKSLALYHAEGAFYATDDLCTHRRAHLSDGYLEGHVVQCPLHFGKFDIISGQPMNPPCTIPIGTYPVAMRGDALFVEIEGAA